MQPVPTDVFDLLLGFLELENQCWLFIFDFGFLFSIYILIFFLSVFFPYLLCFSQREANSRSRQWDCYNEPSSLTYVPGKFNVCRMFMWWQQLSDYSEAWETHPWNWCICPWIKVYGVGLSACMSFCQSLFFQTNIGCKSCLHIIMFMSVYSFLNNFHYINHWLSLSKKMILQLSM